MPNFIVKCYTARSPVAMADALARARRTAECAHDISYLRTTYIPGDETCLHLYEAPSSDSLAEAARRSALGNLRIVEVHEAPVQPAEGVQA